MAAGSSFCRFIKNNSTPAALVEPSSDMAFYATQPMIRLEVPEQTEIDLHQDAIHRIFEGNVDLAKQLLVDCIERAKRYMGIAPSAASTFQSMHLDVIPLVGALGPDDGWQGYDTQSFLLFRNLFGPSFASVQATWTAPEACLFCAAASYNLGMIYHHQGVTDGDLPALSRARSFYCVSLDLLTEGLENNMEATVLTLALYNNLGHLHSFWADHEGVMQCRQDLEQKIVTHGHHIDGDAASFFQQSLMWGDGFVPPGALMA